ncbi:MAG: tripartite tricarboxylate transporter TctB family protein [Candidatus Binatia bacterium]
MNDHQEHSKLNPSFWLSLCFLAVIAAGVVTAARWRWDTRLFPWAVGVPALILALWQLVSDFKGAKSGTGAGREAYTGIMDVPVDTNVPRDGMAPRTINAMAWIAGFVFGIWLLGFLLTIPIFVFLYLKTEAQAANSTALVLSGCTVLFIWGVFDSLMNLAWPEAALFSLIR